MIGVPGPPVGFFTPMYAANPAPRYHVLLLAPSNRHSGGLVPHPCPAFLSHSPLVPSFLEVARLTDLALDPRTPVIRLVDRFGPFAPSARGAGSSPAAPASHPPTVSDAEAWGYVRALATSHYENFSVLSSLVPARLRDDFAAVYAFCRWADDLGDETGNSPDARARATDLLSWWRTELDNCYQGHATHPVYIALRQTIQRHALPITPFADLISAFQQDQTLTEYQTWDQLTDYCRRSADPVGRLVLMLFGYRLEDDLAKGTNRFAMSDATCTALQLTNFWQDVRRDLLERDRVYLPAHDCGLDAATLRSWLDRASDPACRVPFIRAMRPLIDRTQALFDQGSLLVPTLSREARPVVWLFAAGGRRVLSSVRACAGATLWHRPRLSKFSKGFLVLRALADARLASIAGSERAA